VFTDPGAVLSQSRYDYPLAVRVIERAVEGDLVSLARERVFQPLGMENTSFGESVGGLPAIQTTVPDLLRFWSARLDGDLGGFPALPEDQGSLALLDGRGRTFHGGFWGDRIGGQPRFSMMCEAGSASDATGIQVFPESDLILVFWSRTRNPLRRWPSVAAGFLLETIGEDLGLGSNVLEPKRVRGDAEFTAGPRSCKEPGWNSERIDDPGTPVPPEEWAGRYINGDRIFDLQAREGVLWALDGTGLELEVRHLTDHVYFAAMGDRPFWPFRLAKDDQGRRYAVLADRAYIHQDDRSGG
jgi:hypothetical protein